MYETPPLVYFCHSHVEMVIGEVKVVVAGMPHAARAHEVTSVSGVPSDARAKGLGMIGWPPCSARTRTSTCGNRGLSPDGRGGHSRNCVRLGAFVHAGNVPDVTLRPH